jgi:mono/diheme cytochrome c family protein
MNKLTTLSKNLLSLLVIVGMLHACSGDKTTDQQTDDASDTEASTTDPTTNKGIGPISSLTLDATVDQAMADQGKEIYDAKCTACHRATEKFIGPAPLGVLDRRTPEWIMNMILNPEEMTQKDPDARALLIEYNGSPMANQNLTEEEARNVLEYFRTIK